MNMDKIYRQDVIEQKWYQFWQDQGFFKADPNSSQKPYSLLMPPPNLTGELHLGHAMQHAIMDTITRFKRMQGFDVLLLPGVDHAGIQFEGTLNKELAKEGLSKEKLGREKWLERAWKFKTQVYKSFHQTWSVFGISADWSREVFTLEEKVQQATFEQFKTFWEQDLLYKGAYIVQWCPKDVTAIEDIEMEYEERKEKLYFVRYHVILASEARPESQKSGSWTSQDDNYITIATARPETIYADTGVAIYPKHPKFGKFAGKNVINPLTGTKIPIIEDERVEKEFGTGALKITPGHDPLDFEIGRDHNLPILHAIDKTGHMSDLAGKLAGLKAEQAREKSSQILEEKGALEKTEDYTHSVPVCERCKTTVEPLISEEWFIKMKPLADKALQHIKEINFAPKNYLKILTDWIKDIHDWSISRSLWWGHRIPVWYCQKCNPHHLVGKDRDMVVSLEEPDKTCQTCSEKHWQQDEQVLDTWFSSGLWPLSTLGWPSFADSRRPEPTASDEASDGKPDEWKIMQRYYPWGFEISAPEIKFLWIARMIMLGVWFQDNIPFKNMFFHGMLRDLQGRKFSKSLGNGIDPNELKSAWGTDATRMALYTYAIPGRDGRASRQTIDERAKNFRNFATKLINIAKFIIDLKPDNSHSGAKQSEAIESNRLHPDDKLIVEQLNKTIKSVTKNLEEFKLHLASESLYDFVWHKFADKYIEKSKNRRAEAQSVLEYVFKTSLELLHPFMPFITEELWQKLVLSNVEGLPHEGRSIMITKWPS